MAVSRIHLCSVCNRNISSDSVPLKCDCCCKYIHNNCSSLCRNDVDEIINNNRSWSCIKCNETNFPFNHILEEDEFYQSLPVNINQYMYGKMFSNKIFLPFEINDNDVLHGLDLDIDPDLNFFTQLSHHSQFDSKYS